MDLANLGFILRADAEVNGNVALSRSNPNTQARYLAAVATGANWGKLRDTIPTRVQQLARLFREREKATAPGGTANSPSAKSNPNAMAWNHVNKKFFAGKRWSQIKDNPGFLTVEKLSQVLRYIDDVTRSRTI